MAWPDHIARRGIAQPAVIDSEFRSVVDSVSREINSDFSMPGDQAIRASLTAFLSVFEMLRRGWTVTRKSPPSQFGAFVEGLGWQELTIVYKDNVEKLLGAIIRAVECVDAPIAEEEKRRIVEHAKRIHYLKYLEEGEARVIRSHVDRLVRRVPTALFATALALAVVCAAARYAIVGIACAAVAYGALAICGMLWRSFDVELRLLSQRILSGITIEQPYRARLIGRLLEMYEQAEAGAAGAGKALWLREAVRRGPYAASAVSGPRWLNEVVSGDLITAAALAQSRDDVRRVFEFVRERLERVETRSQEERLLLFGVLASLAERVSALRRDRAFRIEYSNWLGECFRLLGLQESRRRLGGAFVDAVTRFGRYQEFMTERFCLAVHHGSAGLWDEFDAYLRHAGRHASPEILAELLRVAETVQPCREGCCYSDGLSRDRVILYPERRHALYKALWVVYLGLREREKALFSHRMTRFLDRAALDPNARIARDILQRMAQHGYLSSPSIVDLLSGRRGCFDPEVREAARELREAYDWRALGHA